MTDYAKKARETDAKLRKKGGTVTLRRTVLGEYDTNTGKPSKTVTDYTAAGVKLSYDAERVDGTAIQSADQELYLSPLQLNGEWLPSPTTADLILIAGVSYAIKSPGKIEPVDVPVLHILQLRGN